LFVLGIFLLTSLAIRRRRSARLPSRTLILALTMYGIVSLPAKVIEPMIALSIVRGDRISSSPGGAWRLALCSRSACCTEWDSPGVLRDLAAGPVQAALVSFNVGVKPGN
jgi:hypothetical protein